MSLILFTQRYVFIRKMQLYFIKYLYFSATTSLLIRTIQGFRLFHSCQFPSAKQPIFASVSPPHTGKKSCQLKSSDTRIHRLFEQRTLNHNLLLKRKPVRSLADTVTDISNITGNTCTVCMFFNLLVPS